MRYKAFKAWCNDRAMDGEWGSNEAKACCEVISKMERKFFKEHTWKKINSDGYYDNIVRLTNEARYKFYINILNKESNCE